MVTVSLDPVAEDVTSPNCPYSVTVHGHVSVNKGPIQVTTKLAMTYVSVGPQNDVLTFKWHRPTSRRRSR